MAFTPAPPIATGTSSFTKSLTCRTRPAAQNAVRMTLGCTVKETLHANPSLKKFVTLAEAAGVDLDTPNCTVFAPNNYAFSQLRDGLVDELLADADAARAIVLRHIVPGHVLTSKQIKGAGYWYTVPGGPLPYEVIGPIIKVAGQPLINGEENDECDNGIIHQLKGVILDAPGYAAVAPSVEQYFVPSYPKLEYLSEVERKYPVPTLGHLEKRALGAAASPSTVGGRKAMGLLRQLPFWQYGPPYNAAKQEDLEPISIAVPGCSSVDYQLMPPGSVIVNPKEVNADKLNPVSGMSKHFGSAKRMVEGDALSDYSRLDD